MNVGVFLHVGFLVESLAAELARVRPRVGVYQQVRGQRRRSLEALAALTTLKATLGAVNCPMLTEADRMSERLTARVTLVRTSTAAVCPTPVDLHAYKSVVLWRQATMIGRRSRRHQRQVI